MTFTVIMVLERWQLTQQCEVDMPQKDEIDLIGHRGLLPETVTQQCAVYMPQKCALRLDPSHAEQVSKSQDDERKKWRRDKKTPGGGKAARRCTPI